jgi:hypothetical protein
MSQVFVVACVAHPAPQRIDDQRELMQQELVRQCEVTPGAFERLP